MPALDQGTGSGSGCFRCQIKRVAKPAHGVLLGSRDTLPVAHSLPEHEGRCRVAVCRSPVQLRNPARQSIWRSGLDIAALEPEAEEAEAESCLGRGGRGVLVPLYRSLHEDE